MTTSDTQLKAALTEMAERLPASENAWNEHERRLAARARTQRRRVTIGAAAACLLLVLGIGIPILAGRDDSSQAASGSKIGPVVVDEHKMNGVLGALWFSVTRSHDAQGNATDTVCRVLTGGAAGGHKLGRQEFPCVRVQVGDGGPARIHPMGTGSCYGGRYAIPSPCVGLSPMILVIATEPEVARLVVDAPTGESIGARELGRTDRLVLYKVWRSGNRDDLRRANEFTYTAHDADGRVIERVTLSDKDVGSWPVR